jgi:signal transduction histidine kinase
MKCTIQQKGQTAKLENALKNFKKERMSNENFEKIVKLTIPIIFGFWTLLVTSAVYGFYNMSSEMNRSISTLMIWIVVFSVGFSIFIIVLFRRLLKLLKTKTDQLEMQKTNLEEQVLYKTNELLKAERFSAIGELSARIAHDVRNPVSIIKNTIEIMKMRELDDKTKTDLQRIEKALERIAHQVNDVLDYVRDAPLKLEKCFISDIVNTTIGTIIFPERIKLKISQSDIPIECDPTKIEAVIRNLLLNAIQAIPGEGKISLRIIEKHGHVLIEVENSGPGIPESVVPKIFDPLFTTKQQGTGLGLPICKTIVEKHEGNISVKTTENRGSVFCIELPKTINSSTHSEELFGKFGGEMSGN